VARALPERVHLPSGRVVRLSDRAARTKVAARSSFAFLEHLEILKAPGVLSDDRGASLDPLGLTLRDAHVLRALLARAAIVDEDAASFTCSNCGARFDVAPSSLLEIGPFVDGELSDPELDAPFDFEKWHPIPAVRAGGSIARRMRLADRTVDEALPLWRTAGVDVLKITPAIIAAMGLVALGRERRASFIADALTAASPSAWAAVVDLFHSAHYSLRLVAVYRCSACSARMDLDVPLERELPREPMDDPAPPSAAFPKRDHFEVLVRSAAKEIYRARGVRNIDLIVDTDVPACDDGGEPLLGCYTPGGVDPELGIPRNPEVRVFYRTFRAEHRADPTFDVEREIHETIDHEVLHHLHHLAGYDPVDDAERAEIDMERARIVGHREVARRAARGFAGDLADFLRVTWPIWVLLAVGSALAFCR
jgi:hypothetical protein